MRWLGAALATVVLLYPALSSALQPSSDEAEARNYLAYYDALATRTWPGIVHKLWDHNNNITEASRDAMLEARLTYSEFSQRAWANASRFNASGFPGDIRRQLRQIMINVGENAFRDPTKLKELKEIKSRMKTRYSTANACRRAGRKDDDCMPFTPDAENLMASSRDYSELLHLWTSWREATGRAGQGDYARYVELSNLAANDVDQPDKGAMWRSWYEVDNLEEQVDNIYQQLRPLYTNLHAYVRRQLYKVYGPDYINLRGPIPAHLLGHMWASEWTSLQDIARPYPSKQVIDITSLLQAQGYTVRRMVEVADDFYSSLGLHPVPDGFYDKSRFTRPEDGRSVTCHAMAWEFYDKVDFRVSMCADVIEDDFLTIHHELGHVQYFMQYRDLPVVYRLPASLAFGEAVGDTVAISAFTSRHLVKIGLLDRLKEDSETDLNFLMAMALEKIAFLPFAIIVDKWRWGVFNGSVTPEQYNDKWWELRNRYQGIASPVPRTQSDFDPPSIYHVSADSTYIRYFLAYIVQFQLYQSLCEHAGHVGPLHKCDFYNSTRAGTVLSDMLRLGISQPWPEVLRMATNRTDFDGAALAEYFSPLTEWLASRNRENGDQPGWPDSDWTPPLPAGWESDASSTLVPSPLWLLVFITAACTFSLTP